MKQKDSDLQSKLVELTNARMQRQKLQSILSLEKDEMLAALPVRDKHGK